MITNTFIFIIVLGGLVFFHELGHFLIAKLFGVGVEKFSLGFGPRILGYKKGLTDYRISVIPLGGYVKMVGDDPKSELEPSMYPYSFEHKHVFKKLLIVLAGPISNVILAFVIICSIFFLSGLPILEPIIGGVIPDTPASNSDLKAGDTIVAINKRPITSWDEMTEIISSSNGANIRISFNRHGIYSTVVIKPLLVESKNIFSQKINKYIIGVKPTSDIVFKKISCLEAITSSFNKIYDMVFLTILSVIKLIQGVISTKTMGGPIMIAEMVGYHARVGIVDLMFFVALLSINLAVLNCLPIPVLDGGHALFFVIELISRKPLNTKFKELAQQTGTIILLLLMAYVLYNDIGRLFLN